RGGERSKSRARRIKSSIVDRACKIIFSYSASLLRISTVMQTALARLKVKGKTLLPIEQGGMGVGISAHRLAGAVASLGAFGTISSVDLRRHHPDLMEQTGRSRDKALINKVNLVALDREIQAARKLSGGNGAIAVNV